VGLPTAADLFDVLPVVVGDDVRRRHLAVWSEFDRWRRSHAGRPTEEFLADVWMNRTSIGRRWVVELVGAVLASRGAGARAGTDPRYWQRIDQPSHCGSHLALWSRALAGATGVVTTNYDITAEQTMRHRPMSRPRSPGFYYGGLTHPQVAHAGARPFARGMPRDIPILGSVPLFKLHGSLNWALRPSADLDPSIERSVELFGDLRPAFRSGGDSAIVPPILEKNVPPWLAPIWEQAELCLSDAATWVVVGYSLPANDEALVELFRRAAGGHLTSVEVWAGPATQARWASVVGRSRIIAHDRITPCAHPLPRRTFTVDPLDPGLWK
jgi:hypothetical protein